MASQHLGGAEKSQRAPIKLTTFEFRIQFKGGPSPGERRYDFEGFGFDPDPSNGWEQPRSKKDSAADYIWTRREVWRGTIEEQVGERLEWEFRGLVYPVVERVNRGSITCAISLMLIAGVPLVSFLNEFQDFYSNLSWLKNQIELVIQGTTEDFLAAEPSIRFEVPVVRGRPVYLRPAPPKKYPPKRKPAFTLKSVLQILVGLFLVFFCMLQFQATRHILGQVWKVVELRHQKVIPVGTEAGLDHQVMFIVHNSGTAAARDVLVRMAVDEAEIVDFTIASEERCEVQDSGLGAGRLDLWFDRLAAGASARVTLVADSSLVESQARVSAVSEQGRSLSDGIVFYQGDLADFEPERPFELGGFLQSISQGPTYYAIRVWTQETGLYDLFSRESAQLIALAIVAAVFLTWLYINGDVAIIVALMGLWVFLYLFVDYEVRGPWFMLLFLGTSIGIGYDVLAANWPPELDLTSFAEYLDDHPALGCILAVLLILIVIIAVIASWRDSTPLYNFVLIFIIIYGYFLYRLVMADPRRSPAGRR